MNNDSCKSTEAHNEKNAVHVPQAIRETSCTLVESHNTCHEAILQKGKKVTNFLSLHIFSPSGIIFYIVQYPTIDVTSVHIAH